MTSICFRTLRAWNTVLSMATSLHENAMSDPDEGDRYERRLGALVEALAECPTPPAGEWAVVELPDDLYPVAQRVLENAQDNAASPPGPDDLHPDEASLSDHPREERSCKTADALLAALRALETADNMPAYWRIHDMLAQRGCEHFDSAGDGTLPMLVDIIIDG